MNLWESILIGAVTSLFLGLLVRQSRQPPVELRDGGFLLQYPTFARVVLAVGALLCLAAGVAAAVSGVRVPLPPLLRVLVLASALPLLWLVRFLWRERDTVVLVDDDGIRMRDWRGAHRMLAWRDLVELRWSRSGSWWRLDGRDGVRLRVNGMLQGVDRLLKAIRQHVPEAHWKRWRHQVERYQQGRKLHQG